MNMTLRVTTYVNCINPQFIVFCCQWISLELDRLEAPLCDTREGQCQPKVLGPPGPSVQPAQALKICHR